MTDPRLLTLREAADDYAAAHERVEEAFLGGRRATFEHMQREARCLSALMYAGHVLGMPLDELHADEWAADFLRGVGMFAEADTLIEQITEGEMVG